MTLVNPSLSFHSIGQFIPRFNFITFDTQSEEYEQVERMEFKLHLQSLRVLQ